MEKISNQLRSLLEGEPKMDGSTVASWPKYHDRPGQVGVSIPYPVANTIYKAADELDRLYAEIDRLKGRRRVHDEAVYEQDLSKAQSTPPIVRISRSKL